MKLWKIIKTLLTLQSTLSASLFMEIIVYFHLSSFLFQCMAANSMAANEPSASSFSHRLVTMGNLVTAQTRVAVGTKEFYSSVQDTHNQECSASMRFFHSTWSIFQQRLNIIYWEYRKKASDDNRMRHVREERKEDKSTPGFHPHLNLINHCLPWRTPCAYLFALFSSQGYHNIQPQWLLGTFVCD